MRREKGLDDEMPDCEACGAWWPHHHEGCRLFAPVPTDVSKAAAALGRLGGEAGRGESKRRGDSAHYRATVAKRWGRSTGERPRGDYVSFGGALTGRVYYPVSGRRQREIARERMSKSNRMQLPIVRWTGAEWQDTGLVLSAR